MQTNATKERAREFMQQRQQGHRPLPSMQEIRRVLGWDLVDAARTVERDDPVSTNQVFA
jgi:hypothetical protein